MAEKGNTMDAQKRLQHAQPSTGRFPVISTKHTFLRRLISVLCVVGSLHILFLRFSPGYGHPYINDASYDGLIDAFKLDHGVLNGKRAEQIFLQVPNANSAIEASRLYARRAHMAGTKQDFETAKYVLQHFDFSFGLSSVEDIPVFSAGSAESRSATLDIGKTTEPRAWIDTYYPVLSTPGERSLQVLDQNGTVIWTADIEEHGDPLDEDANNAAPSAPVFHGLSKGGDVTGEVFYANYCRPEDYEAVEKSGVNITGKIALCRYGGLFRGLKVKGAQERGAVGCLIYSDTRDDGSATVENGYEIYPAGPARNPTSVQRGSVQFISAYPGDPTTPGYPSYKNSSRTEATNIPSIPSLPISSANARKLLEEVGRNGTKRTVRLANEANHDVTPIWNTMTVIPGYIKSEVVMIGNHRDAWVLGATDPTSGTTSIHEVVRGFGELYRRGWKPLRTILLASWDAEEFGLVGSTEWVEDFPEWIKENVVAYINLDVSVSGSRFNAKGSPSMAHLLKGVAEELPHPTKEGLTLWDARNDIGPFTGQMDPEFAAMAAVEAKLAQEGLGVAPLGSGSDYTAFLQRLGIASSDGGFGSSGSDAAYHYHSIYDSQRSQELYVDPGFHRHVAAAKYVGLTALRLADSIVLPLNTTFYALELFNYVNKVTEVIPQGQESIDLSPLRESVNNLYTASLKLDEEKERAEKHLWRVIKHWQKHHGLGHHRHHRHHHHRHRHHRHPHGLHRDNGKETHSDGHVSEVKSVLRRSCASRWRRLTAYIKGLLGVAASGLDTSPHPRHPCRRHRKLPRKLIRAVKRIQAVNKKVSTFEAGFINEEGLIDREWFKHLGVAPGKWLGYGATTFPGLTEAFTIAHNTTLAKYEMGRLVTNLNKFAKDIAV